MSPFPSLDSLLKWSRSLKSQRFRHMLTTTVACATLMSLITPRAFAEPAAEVSRNIDTVQSIDTEKDFTVTEEVTTDTHTVDQADSKNITDTSKDLDKEDLAKDIKDAADTAATTGEKTSAPKSPEAEKPAKAEEKKSADKKSTENALTWGVRSSFNNYTGGPTKVFDGAEQNEQKNQFTFQLYSVTYDKDKEKLEAKFKGGVHYQKYCTDNTNHTGCELDLKIENPRIVMSKEGSHVFAKVSSKKYKSAETYTNEGTDDTKPLATLYTANARFEEKDGKVIWSEIPALLTKDGSEMFSEFYPVNSALDSLTFSFEKSKLNGSSGDYKRLSTDNAKYVVAAEKFDNDVKYEQHRELFKFKDHVIVATSDHRFTPEKNPGFALLDRDLNQKASKNLRLNNYGAVAFDEANGDLYYVAKKEPEGNGGNRNLPANDDRKVLHKLHVDVKDGFKEASVVHTFADEITALGYNPYTKQVVVVTEKQTAIVNQASISPINLPEQSELAKQGDFTNPENLYGEVTDSNPEVNELLPMKDGSFVLNGDLSRAKKGEQKYYGLMVSINPKDTKNPAKLLKDSATESADIDSSAAHTNGETIIRYNKNVSEEYAVAQSFKFNNGSLAKESAGVVKGKDADIKNWGNAFVLEDGIVMALDAKDGMIKHVDAKLFKTISDEKQDEYGRKFEPIAFPKGAKTGSHQHGAILQLDKGTFYVPSYEDVKGESEETYVLRKIYDPKFTPKPHEQEREFPNFDEDKDNGDNNNNDGRDGNNHNNDAGSALSKTWATILGVLGALGGILGIFGVANHFFGDHIRHLIDQFRR
ncbi:Cell-surface hemin receptor [Corynebacterium kutscheri]|uniref:Cell-surface hemin receptor n=1 Tax=Corynebacterium kutscheri TaxID=35755 RepID=A0AB38VS98_9CORY|nr:Cell-surface hemin receptor [Corynebacterium kutscheri]